MVTGSTRLATGEMSSSCLESLRPPRNLVMEMMAESSMSTRNLGHTSVKPNKSKYFVAVLTL